MKTFKEFAKEFELKKVTLARVKEFNGNIALKETTLSRVFMNFKNEKKQ